MNRREGSRLSKDRDPDLDDIDVKRQTIEPKQTIKVIPTPRIKLKHNDISDEEFRILMEHQRTLKEEVCIFFIYYLPKFFFFNKKYAYIFNSNLFRLGIYYLQEH